MPLLPNFVERLVLLRLNQGPGALLDLFGAGAFRIVTSALEFGIFDALSLGPLTVGELSQRTDTNERGLGILLAALEAFGYVQATESCYANTPLTAKWLLGTSPGHLANFLRWWQQLVFEFWDEYFEETIRNGRVVILDQMGDRAFGPVTRAANSLIALAYFILLGGQTFTSEEVEGWLRKAGLAVVSRKSLLKAPGTILLTAARED